MSFTEPSQENHQTGSEDLLGSWDFFSTRRGGSDLFQNKDIALNRDKGVEGEIPTLGTDLIVCFSILINLTTSLPPPPGHPMSKLLC